MRRCPYCKRLKWPWSSVIVTRGLVMHRACAWNYELYPDNSQIDKQTVQGEHGPELKNLPKGSQT